jgi:membrane fusion protein (multidrug efflux system)
MHLRVETRLRKRQSVRTTRKYSCAALPLGIALMLAGCAQSDAQNQRGPVEVGFVVAQRSAVPDQALLGGRTVAFESSEVRPQVSGLIRRRNFTEGSYVRQGQPLFQIDPSLYRAAVNQAQANVASSRATLDAAQVRANRYKPLAEMEAISKQEYTDAAAQARQARAGVAQNGAALETARINLRFTSIPAPISGRIGRSLSTVGALVTANQAEPLAVIQRLDPMYVDIQQSSADLTKLRRALSAGGVTAGSTQVRLKLEDGTDYGYTGSVQFSEVMVNESTGTVTLRARFPNPQNVLLPGMFVQALFTQAVDQGVFLVPQAALQRDIGGDAFVFLVGAANKVERRKVVAERTFGTNWVVSGGLQPGDKVITQGTSNLRSGAPIKPVPANVRQQVEPRQAGTGGGRGRQGG